IIVDDASRDKSGEIAKRLSKEFSQLKVLDNLVNLGQATSILRGFRVARGDLIFHNGVDAPFDIDDFKEMLPLLADADVVVASRTGRSASSLWRKITSIVNKSLLHLLFRPGVSDTNFIQIYKKRVLEDPDVINVFARSPAFVTPELIIRSRKKGYKIAQFNTEFHRRKAGKPNCGRPHDIIWTLYDMLRFRIKLFSLKVSPSSR
ncbi:MAG: glycosyltransferase, partial [Deltaproteobacteria bacterium]